MKTSSRPARSWPPTSRGGGAEAAVGRGACTALSGAGGVGGTRQIDVKVQLVKQHRG